MDSKKTFNIHVIGNTESGEKEDLAERYSKK